MANTFTPGERLWALDTPSTSAVVDANYLRVSSIRWEAGTSGAAGDHCTFKDPLTGNIIWDSIATGADWLDLDNAKRHWQNGFILCALAHGTVYLILE